MNTKNMHAQLSRRESQIMDALYKIKQGSVHDVLEAMDQPPSYNSVRVILGILETKGFVSHFKASRQYIYQPKKAQPKAAHAATKHLLETFFANSTPQAVATLIDVSSSQMADKELDELSAIIAAAKQKKAGHNDES